MSGALIALDWGTTNVRAALLDTDGEVLELRHGESGVGRLDAAGFAARYAELTDGWPDVPAIACGMVGSRQGWAEADYLPCPTGVADLAAHLLPVGPVHIVPGLKVETDSQRDVMRGEETQIAGLLARMPDYSGTVVMPGTHCKWANVHEGIVTGFRTYMTGDLFAALSGHTILRHSIGDDGSAPDGTFTNAVRDAIAAPGSLAGSLFGIRAETILRGVSGVAGRERLSGLLIGMELEAAARDGFDVQDVTIIGDGAMVARYRDALGVLDAAVQTFASDALIWPALIAIARHAGLLETTR